MSGSVEQTEAEALPGGKPETEDLRPERTTPAAGERAPKIGKSVGMPPDLAELATLWDQVPEVIRQSWLLTAKALAKGKA